MVPTPTRRRSKSGIACKCEEGGWSRLCNQCQKPWYLDPSLSLSLALLPMTQDGRASLSSPRLIFTFISSIQMLNFMEAYSMCSMHHCNVRFIVTKYIQEYTQIRWVSNYDDGRPLAFVYQCMRRAACLYLYMEWKRTSQGEIYANNLMEEDMEEETRRWGRRGTRSGRCSTRRKAMISLSGPWVNIYIFSI